MFYNTEKTETRHGNVPHILFGDRTTTPKSLKEAGFIFLFHKLVFIVSHVEWCARTRPNVRIFVLEKESASGSTLRSHEQSMEHKDPTITFSCRCNWSLWRIDTELAGQVSQCQQYWKSLLQRLVSVLKFNAERGLTFRDDENGGSPRNFLQAKFQKQKARCFWWPVLQHKSLIIVNYHVSS